MPPFSPRPTRPGTIRHVLDEIGHAITSALRSIERGLRRALFHPISHSAHVAFGPLGNVVLIALGALLVAAGAWAWTRRTRRRGTDVRPDVTSDADRPRVAELLDLAARAMASGELDRALRLRFEAGLERLEDRGILHERRTLTSGAVASQLDSRRFDELARTHALVAYAGAPASATDVEDAFREWPAVLEEARAGAAVAP